MARIREKHINFYLSKDEYLRVIKNKDMAELSLSDYIRKCILKKEIKKIYGLKETLFELNRIGNNLNQITKKINQGAVKDPGSSLKEINKKLDSLFEEIIKII